MKRLSFIFFILLICFMESCNYQLFVDKRSIVKYEDGYILKMENEVIFFPAGDTTDETFIKNNHLNGYKLNEGRNIDWLYTYCKSYPIQISSNNSYFDSMFIIPVTVKYYLGKYWKKNNDKVTLDFYYKQQPIMFSYYIYDSREILLISMRRKSDINKLNKLTK